MCDFSLSALLAYLARWVCAIKRNVIGMWLKDFRVCTSLDLEREAKGEGTHIVRAHWAFNTVILNVAVQEKKIGYRNYAEMTEATQNASVFNMPWRCAINVKWVGQKWNPSKLENQGSNRIGSSLISSFFNIMVYCICSMFAIDEQIHCRWKVHRVSHRFPEHSIYRITWK